MHCNLILTEPSGEQGKVDESMREMAAIEALKSEKSDKEVRHISILLWKRANSENSF